MPGPNAWTAIPTTLLDLGQKTADAEAWAAGQRAQLAETWANAQRQAVQAMADTWQRGNDTQDSYQSGYQGAQDGATGPTGPLGYNDMAGASSSGSAPGFGANPEDVSSPIEQARASGTGPQLLGGETPISDIPGNAASALSRRVGYFSSLTEPDQPNTSGKLLGGFSPEHLQAGNEEIGTAAVGAIGGIENEGAKLAGVTRFFHGTGSSFGVPDAARFSPDGLFGPGYYLTDEPRVASSYAGGGLTPEQDKSATALGRLIAKNKAAGDTANVNYLQKTLDNLLANSDASQVRAVNVPNDLKLLDAEASVPQGVVTRLRDVLPSPTLQRRFDNSLKSRSGTDVTGSDLWSSLRLAIDTGSDADPALVNQTLQQAGYDGIRYAGGKRIPMTDAAGAPIEHTAVVIFPASMGKLTNAISGTRFGSPPAVGGAIVGGLAGATQPAQNDQERARNIALGAVGGGVGGHLVGSGQLGRLAGEESGAIGKLPKAATATPGEQRAGNILLRKYVDPEVQQVIADAAAKDPQAMEAARRGVVSDTTVQQLADAAGTTVGKVIARWKPGDIANAETITAMKTALDGKAREVIDAQKAIQGGDNATASLLRLQLATKEHQAIQEAVSGGTAELGRGLRALRQNVKQALQANDVTRMNDLLKKLGGAEWTQELASKLGELDTSDPTQVHTFLRDIAKAKAPDYINEWLYNAILSNPSTHIANSVSNTVNALLGPVERYAAGAIDAPLAAIQGRPRGRFFGEGTESAYGLLQGLPEGLRSGWYALQHGFSEATAVKGEMPRAQAFKGPIGNAINTPSRLLTAADAFMQPIVKRSALNVEIFRKAASEGLKGQALKDRIVELTANVPADLMERADKYAEYQLYRQAPKTLGKGLASIRGLNVYGFEPLRFVLPFVQVPINATKYGLERSPLGFLNPDLWKALGKKDPAASEMLARAGLGSFFAAAIGAGVQTGKIDITGAAPTAPAQRDAFYRQGKLPFSVKIGDTWHSYQRVEPLNHSLTQVAAVVDALRNNKQGASLTDQATQAAFSIGQNIESQTFFTQINNLVNAMSDPGRYGAQFVASLETSMVPGSSLMRATANTLDPRQRSPQGAIENVENVIPGLSRNVPSNLNNYGEEQGIAGSPFLPYKSQTANDSPLELELARLRVEPGAAGKSVRGIDLSRQENQDYQRLSGGLVKAALTQVMNDPRYRSLDDTRKAAALTRIIGHAKDLAAQRFIGQLAASQGKAALLQRIAAKKRAALPRAG